MSDPESRARFQRARGKGGFRRASWDEVQEIIAASCIHTIKKHGPDRIIGFSPIPAMSFLVLWRRFAFSAADGRRKSELLRLVLRSAARFAGNLGRANRCLRKRRLVQLEIYRGDGFESEHDPHARLSLRRRGPSQRNKNGCHGTRLQSGRKIRRPVDPGSCGSGRRLLDGGQSRHPKGISPRDKRPLFYRLCKTLYRFAVPDRTCQRRQRL